jgi:rubrerythrin
MVTVQRRESEKITGIKNETYNLISVAHEALEECPKYDIYIRDAQESNDQELVEFFQNLQTQTRQTAQQAQSLLKNRLG